MRLTYNSEYSMVDLPVSIRVRQATAWIPVLVALPSRDQGSESRVIHCDSLATSRKSISDDWLALLR